LINLSSCTVEGCTNPLATNYNIDAELPLLTACVERDTTIEAVCGEAYTWNYF